jgi:GT2 family glycosyltransferase
LKFTKSKQIIKGLRAAIQQWLDETLAVLVLYQTPLDKSITFNSLQTSLKNRNSSIDWFVYDNSPTDEASEKIHDPKIMIRRDASNPGVSKAYNEGFKVAKSLGKKWMLLLDQDSDFTIDAFKKYYQALLKNPHESCFVPLLVDKKGVISPFKFHLGNGIRVNSVREGVHSLNKLQFINSGLMISLNAFGQSNGYDEEFPLDFSDYAFVERIHLITPGFVLIPLTVHHGHSSSQDISQTEALKRFNVFLEAAKLFRKKYHPDNILIILRPLLHAIRLSIRHTSFSFVLKFFEGKSHD